MKCVGRCPLRDVQWLTVRLSLLLSHKRRAIPDSLVTSDPDTFLKSAPGSPLGPDVQMVFSVCRHGCPVTSSGAVLRPGSSDGHRTDMVRKPGPARHWDWTAGLDHHQAKYFLISNETLTPLTRSESGMMMISENTTIHQQLQVTNSNFNNGTSDIIH